MPVNNTLIHTATDTVSKIIKQTYITIHTADYEIETAALIIPNLIYDVIIGIDTLAKINAVINFKENTLTCFFNNKKHCIQLGIQLIFINIQSKLQTNQSLYVKFTQYPYIIRNK